MAKAVVLLFVLDSLPGLIGVSCDPTLTTPVIEVIGKKLHLTANEEQLQHIELTNPYSSTHKFQELSPESLNTIGFFDNFVEDSYEFSGENSRSNLIEHNFKENVTKHADIDVHDPTFIENMSYPMFPQRAPFLAAIFETVGKVTAQTCGGVVVSPRLVLSAASCVNVLGPIVINSSRETTDNYYTVIIDAKDPLVSGSVHQVSEIYLHPMPKMSLNQSSPEDLNKLLRKWFHLIVATDAMVTTPALALLKIQPPLETGFLKTLDNKILWDSDSAKVYGWALNNAKPGLSMVSTSSAAQRVNPEQCTKTYGILKNTNTLCLSIKINDNYATDNRITTGCPVVVLQGGYPRLFAIALADGSHLLLANPIASHNNWLQEHIGEDSKGSIN